MDNPAGESGLPERRKECPQGSEEDHAALAKHLFELQRMNRALRLLSAVNQALTHATTEAELIRQICEIAVDVGHYRLAWVGFAEHDTARTVRPICHAGHEEGFLHQITFSWADTTQDHDPTGTAIHTGTPTMVPDIMMAPADTPWREAALARGYRSMIALPLVIDEQVIGALTLHGDEPQDSSPEEMPLLVELAGDLSYGISAIRTRERQRRIEEDLYESERRLHALLEAAPYGAHEYELHTNGRLVFVGYNPAANRILGVDHANFLGQTIEETFPPLAETAIPETYRRVARTGERYEDEQVTYAHGEIAGAFDISAFQTAPNRMAVFFRDITERKRAEQRLQESEEKYHFLFDTMTQGIVLQDAESRIVEANRAASAILSVSRDQLLGNTSFDPRWVLIHEDYSPLEPEEMPSNIALRTGKPVAGVICGVKFDDNYHWIIISSVPKCRAGGEKPYLTMTTFTDVTELKRTEEALRQSEAMIGSIYRAAPAGIGIVVNRIITEVNDRFVTMTGYSRDELVGHNSRILYSSQDAYEEVGRIYEKEVRAKGVGTIEVQWLRKDGMRIDVLVSIAPLDPTDWSKGITITALDITERKKAENALRESEERFRTLIEQAPVAIGMARHMMGTYANPCYMRMFRFRSQEDTTVPVVERYAPQVREWINENLLAREEGRPAEMEYDSIGLRADGTEFPMHVAITRVILPGGETTVAFITDITERKRAEEAMQQESTFLASAIELLPFPIFFITPSREVIRQNRATVSLQHAPNTQPLNEVELLDPQTYTPYSIPQWPITQALRGEITPTKEFIMRQPDGREMPILLQTAPIFINDELVAAVVAIQDLTALKEADRAKNQFLMVLSHEIKTPLTSIIGWAQLAQSAPEMSQEALATILRNAHEQKHLLERLLILSRILTGKLIVTRHATDLWRVALQAEQRVYPFATERKITLNLLPPGDALYVEADDKLLEQAIYEVIDNAINFTPSGGVITIQGHREESTNILMVQDTGQGIAPELLSTLHKPFSQLQRREEIGGLGIGLALVRGIIEVHGGHVAITSAGPGQGTTVMLKLPAS